MTRYHDKVESYGARALDRCLQGITIPTIVLYQATEVIR